ncbi:hypothetical protein F5Y12DRAFT_766073 [Xylaria sp. FL1777]|nr:hypothetical protein F5Y12DRAFT_766073 [Xylaria sp. FL1777]
MPLVHVLCTFALLGNDGVVWWFGRGDGCRLKSCSRFVMQVRLGRCDRGKALFFKHLLEAVVKLNLVMQPAWNPTKAGAPLDSTKFLEALRHAIESRGRTRGLPTPKVYHVQTTVCTYLYCGYVLDNLHHDSS